jgi:hypothetical protein
VASLDDRWDPNYTCKPVCRPEVQGAHTKSMVEVMPCRATDPHVLYSLQKPSTPQQQQGYPDDSQRASKAALRWQHKLTICSTAGPEPL